MPLSPSLQRFAEEEVARAGDLVDRTIELTLEQLRQPRDGALGSATRLQYDDVVSALRSHAAPFKREFCDTLRRLVLSDADNPNEPSSGTSGGLELMDESRVEGDIEVSRAVQLIVGAAEWELRELQTFTSTLAGQAHVSADTNPTSPLSYARSLWEATCAVTPVPVQRGILLRTAAGVLSGQLKMAWAAACTRLEDRGVEPGIYRTMVMAPGAAVPQAPTFDVTRPGALEALRSTMPGAGVDTSGGPLTGAGAHLRSAGGLNPGFEQALSRVEELLRDVLPGRGGPATQAGRQLGEHRAELMASTSATVDKQIVELLSRLFETVLSDKRLPAAFRAVIARLQVSALRVALVDSSMLDSHDHPVWRLMNRIANASETYTNISDPRMAGLLAYCEALIDDMARAPVQDALLYRHSLGRLDAFLGEQLREQQQLAQPTIEALMRAERRDELERQFSRRLTEQMVNIRTSPVIRRFVTGTWAKVLAEALLHLDDGKGEPPVDYLKTVDELLWSLRLPDHPQSRKRLLELLPGLLQRLRAGMTSIAWPAADQQLVLDELIAVHTEALRPGKNTPQNEPTSQEIVQRLRDEAAYDTSGQSPFSDSLVDLSSMETVPADILPVSAPPEEDQAKGVDIMIPGGRYRIFLHGRWTQVQLLWRSSQYFVFASAEPGRTHSVTRRALERLSEEGLLKPIDQSTLIQRAVDGVVNRLRRSSDAS